MTRSEVKANVQSELRKHFRPELLNRIDEIIIFKKLSEAEKEEWYKRNQIDKYSSIILLQDQKDYMNKIDDVLTKYGWILKKEPVDAQICGDYYLYLYEKTK